MIGSLSGNLRIKQPSKLLIDCNGVGYEVTISVKTFSHMPDCGSAVYIHTILIVREDKFELFGFLNLEEKAIFTLLTSISGIGPKSAIGILSSIEPNDLYEAIATNNIYLLQKMPGIGKKTAERLVLELRDKIDKVYSSTELDSNGQSQSSNRTEAVAALQALGFNANQSERAVNSAMKELIKDNPSLENIIKAALKNAVS
jgi:holliday junction DNA helicase RuvA